MKKGGYLRLRINRQRGSIEWVTGLFFLLFLTILLCVQMQLAAYRSTSLYLEDALAASNLASAVIDLEEYGISNTVRISNLDEAYRKYMNAVKRNLNLDENWEGTNTALISGKVSVVNYSIYNVSDNAVSVFQVSEDGRIHTWEGVLGYVTSPNGVLIENTGVYSELSFPVRGLFGITVTAHKGKFVDIASKKEEIKTEGE